MEAITSAVLNTPGSSRAPGKRILVPLLKTVVGEKANRATIDPAMQAPFNDPLPAALQPVDG